MTVTKDAAGKRIAKSIRKFTYDGGKEPGQVALGATSLVIEIPENGQIVTSKADFDEPMWNALGYFGLKQVIGHAIGGSEDGAEAFEAAMARLETLKAGEWREGVAGEARPSMLAEALVRVYAAQGKTLTLEDVLKWLSQQSEEQRKEVAKIPEVKVEYETLRQEAAAKRLAEQRAKLSGQSGVSSGLAGLTLGA